MAVSTVSLRKSHDIVILSFYNIVKGQAKYYHVCQTELTMKSTDECQMSS